MDFIATKTKYESKRHYDLLVKSGIDYGIERAIKQIEENNWTLYDVLLDKTLVGIFICRVDKQITDENELVILHAASVLEAHVPFYAILEPLFDIIAKESNCKSIRIHSFVESCARLIKKNSDNFKVAETILRKIL